MHKRSGGWVSNIQVVHRQAMRLNGCFPKNTIYIYIQYLEPDRDNLIYASHALSKLEGVVQDHSPFIKTLYIVYSLNKITKGWMGKLWKGWMW